MFTLKVERSFSPRIIIGQKRVSELITIFKSIISLTMNMQGQEVCYRGRVIRQAISWNRTLITNGYEFRAHAHSQQIGGFFDNLAENVQDVLQTGNALLFPVSLCTHLFSLRLSQKVTPSSNLDLISGPTEQKSDKVATAEMKIF